jgi:hypothetical protein
MPKTPQPLWMKLTESFNCMEKYRPHCEMKIENYRFGWSLISLIIHKTFKTKRKYTKILVIYFTMVKLQFFYFPVFTLCCLLFKKSCISKIHFLHWYSACLASVSSEFKPQYRQKNNKIKNAFLGSIFF